MARGSVSLPLSAQTKHHLPCVPASSTTWLGCSLQSSPPSGWGNVTECQYGPEDPTVPFSPSSCVTSHSSHRFESVEAGLLAQGFRFCAKLKKKARVSSEEMEEGPSLKTIPFVRLKSDNHCGVRPGC